MRITTFTDYTLRVLMYLALKEKPNEPSESRESVALATIPEIAAAYGISSNHLMKVVHHLARTGTIESIRGKGGGIRLAAAPDQIRLGQVIRASESNGPIVECLGEEPGVCKIAPVCRLANILGTAFEALYASLDQYTLADLTRQSKPLQGLLFSTSTAPTTKRGKS
ncbi:Predicted transcriptional regulator [gamma proteobacterium HdN1]|nr:Predicted transcriptional regulator [gamma proteobacterium HdN1]